MESSQGLRDDWLEANGLLSEKERAFLMGTQVWGDQSLFSAEDSLDELEQLAGTAGVQVVGRNIQHLNAINPATYIGSGKVEELRLLRQELGFNLLIFDDELSSAQLRNLERAMGIKILDRTALILDIFAMHARTKEGALQVALAQYTYRLPRLTRQWTHLSRQGVGGVGLRGPGETQLESDRREISRYMVRLQNELEQVRRQRGLQRRRRRRQGMSVVAIVGYTNAGKSTLINRLADAQVLVEDKLFATLDPTTRRVALPSGKAVLFTDTVGFIQKLPTQLVAAFRATLEEVQEADLLVNVADISDPHLLKKVEAVEEVLKEIGAGDKPVIMALNKVDLIDPDTDLHPDTGRFALRHSAVDELLQTYNHTVTISAEQGVGIEELLGMVERVLIDQMVEVEATIPYRAGELLDLWHRQGIVDEETYTPSGTKVRGKLPKWMLGMLTNGEEKEEAVDQT
ncbi:MAG: GTPase HflX [Chloroflexi bacterium RBG_13_56_8]|nr:MAG: GTPase HflX [Chloroflexi bacterium RBG_13_56_8]